MKRSGRQHGPSRVTSGPSGVASAADAAKHETAPSAGLARAVLPLATALGVALVTLAVHYPVLDCRAVCFDDDMFLFKNPYLMNPSWSSVGRTLSEVTDSSTIKGYYEPLTLISLMCDVAVGGGPTNLRPFHRTSLTLHAINSSLMVALLYIVFGNLPAAGLAALVFGLHPLTVEPVAWVWERKTPLATLFVLLCLLSYTAFAHRGRWSLYAVSLLAFVLAVMSKPTAVPLPLCLVLLDIWPLRRSGRRALPEKLPFLAVALIAGLIALVSTGRSAGVTLPHESPGGPVVWRVIYLIPFYLGKVLYPANLSPYYQLPTPLALSSPAVLAALLALAAVAATIILSLRWTRTVAVGLGVFLLLISPTLGVIGYSWIIASDKYVYLPAIGLLLLTCAGLALGWSRLATCGGHTRIACAVACLLLIGIEAMTARRQIEHWRSTESLFRHAVALAPNAAVPRNYLALALVDRSAVDEAIAEWLQAVRLNPQYAIAYCNLGNACLIKRELDRGVEYYRRALALDPHYPEAHYNIARALASLGDHRSAVDHYKEAISLRPYYALAHNALAVELARRRELAGAQQHLRTALTLAPGLAATDRSFAYDFARAGDLDAAVLLLGEVLRIHPEDARLRRDLTALLNARASAASSRPEAPQQPLPTTPAPAASSRP